MLFATFSLAIEASPNHPSPGGGQSNTSFPNTIVSAHSPTIVAPTVRCLAHFDVRDASTSCLKLRDERTQRGHRNSVAIDPHVWSGRALQKSSSSCLIAVLHQCIRPLIGAIELRAIMDISARAISLTDTGHVDAIHSVVASTSKLASGVARRTHNHTKSRRLFQAATSFKKSLAPSAMRQRSPRSRTRSSRMPCQATRSNRLF